MSEKLPNEGTSIISASDEAYVLLAFENYRDFWIAAWKKDVYGEEGECQTKWTRKGPPKDPYMPWGEGT